MRGLEGGVGGERSIYEPASHAIHASHEKKKSVIKLQIREEWFAMGMWSFVAGIFCRIAYVHEAAKFAKIGKLEGSGSCFVICLQLPPPRLVHKLFAGGKVM